MTVGAQRAIDLVARVLVEPGTVVAVEDPGYSAAHRLFETHRAAVRQVPSTERVSSSTLSGRRQGRLCDAVPSVPDGGRHVLGAPRCLLRWAVDHDAAIVEDDYDSEFRFSDQPLEPIQSLDHEGRVICVGTFSRS